MSSPINPEETKAEARPKPPTRLDYVKYDEQAQKVQKTFKAMVDLLLKSIESELKSVRPRALAITKLEEAYMWIGKAVRDDQIQRNGTAELQEERGGG